MSTSSATSTTAATRHDESTARRSRWLLAALVFIGSFFFRLLDPGFTNDHFRLLAQARQILDGEAPFRDFLDPGVFLQIYTSAAFQWLFGYNLLGEAMLCITFFSAGFALTFLLAAHASRSLAIGLLVTVFAVAFAPRLYSYDKIFWLVCGLLACWSYVDRRTAVRLAGLALCTAVAFLFRHDHGVYIGAAAVVTLVSVHWAEGFGRVARRTAAYGAFVVLALLPFFAFLQLNGGVVEYFRSAIEYTVVRGEGKRSGLAARTAFVLQPPKTLFTVEPAPPRTDARIEVEWEEGVGADRQAELERKYQLAEPVPLRGRRWQYSVLDLSRSNVKALVKDRRIDDVDGVNRSTYQLQSAPPEPWTTSWQRALPLLRIRILPDILQPANAVPWLYHLVVGLPLLATLVLVLKRVGKRPTRAMMVNETPKILSAAALCVVADYLLVRNPLEVRIADAATPTAVVAAWLLGQAFGFGAAAPTPAPDDAPVRRSPNRRPSLASVAAISGRAMVLMILAVTMLSIVNVSDFGDQIETSDMAGGLGAMLSRGGEVLEELGTSPPIDDWAPRGSNGLQALTRYVYECTRPDDRLLTTSFIPDAYYYAERGFAGGQLFWFSNYHAAEHEQQWSLEKLRRESVPIILMDVESSRDFSSDFPLLQQHIARNYRLAREATFGADRPFRVLVDRRLAPSGTYRPLSLPCFS